MKKIINNHQLKHTEEKLLKMKKQKQKKHRYEKGKLKPDGRLKPGEIFRLTKDEDLAFRKAAREEREQKKKDFKVGGCDGFQNR